VIEPMESGRDQPRDEMRLKETTAGAGPAMVRAMRRPLALLPALGPGLIAGASDNDPTTVATLAVIGSSTAYGLAWLVVLAIPMLVVVQVVSASVGVVARVGLEDVIRVRYGRLWGLVALLLVLAVNLLTLAADLKGGSAALSLLTGRPYQWFMLLFALAVGAFLIWGSYRALERVLRYVLLVFLGYIVTAFLAHPNWGQVLHDTLVPRVSFSPAYVAGGLALLGTTLTSYAYVWETIAEAQEKPSLDHLGLVQVDAGLGMVMAGVIFWFIVVGTGATLGVHHKPVQTAQDAAAALAPLAGRFAPAIFGVGLLASAVLAVPVLAGTSAYVMAEAFGWRASLDERFAQAPAFYASLLLSLAVGVGVAYVGVSPIRLLFLSGIAGGLATPVTLAFMMRAARDRRIMGDHRIGGHLAAAGWLVTAVVTAASILYLWQTFARPGH
jgi:Mn2+/Fe2+ NRAMP family transporter